MSVTRCKWAEKWHDKKALKTQYFLTGVVLVATLAVITGVAHAEEKPKKQCPDWQMLICIPDKPCICVVRDTRSIPGHGVEDIFIGQPKSASPG